MKTKPKAKTTSVSSKPILPASALPLHASKQLLLDVDRVSVVLGGETVVSDVSFCVHQGEFIGLIGPNGAGKTTLLRILLGLFPATSGAVSGVASHRVGYIPQGVRRYDSQVAISVGEVVRLGSKGNVALAREALEAVGLAHVEHRRFDDLSGGQQQRVLIAKAMAEQPDLLILDEPTTGIDEPSQTAFFDTLRTLQERGIAILMVSHDVDAVLSLVTRVICLNRSLLYDGAPEHFEADKYLPDYYTAQHLQLHHRHEGGAHA